MKSDKKFENEQFNIEEEDEALEEDKKP